MQSRGLNLQKGSRSGPVSQNDITYPRPLHKVLFIWSYANSVIAAHEIWRAVRMNIWFQCVCPDSGKVAKGALAGDQTKVKAVLPSDWPHVFCQGQLPAEERLPRYQRQATWFKSNCHRFPIHLAQGNICPSHWAESKSSSRPYLKEWGLAGRKL